MTEISNQFLCAVLIIILAITIPHYIQLPAGLELLFHDKIGQVLVLLLAAVIGSYNLLCGLLLVVLFISIMLKSPVLEGFDNSLTPEEKAILRKMGEPEMPSEMDSTSNPTDMFNKDGKDLRKDPSFDMPSMKESLFTKPPTSSTSITTASLMDEMSKSSMPTMNPELSMTTMQSNLSGSSGSYGSDKLSTELIKTNIDKLKLEMELNKYKIDEMEKQLKTSEPFDPLNTSNHKSRQKHMEKSNMDLITPKPSRTPMLTQKPTNSSNKKHNQRKTPEPTIEPFVSNMGDNNNALPKSFNSQFDIPPLDVTITKRPIGKPGEQEKLYHNFNLETSRLPNFEESVNNSDESDNKLKTNQTRYDEEEQAQSQNTTEGFYSAMNSRFSGPTPAFTSQPYQTVPEHPPVPEFNVEEAENLFSNYNGGTSRTPNYINKSGMVEGFVGETVKSLKTKNPYDAAGCRYDGNTEKPLHDVIYGAPVASCDAYGNLSKVSGTVFYPLNA